MKKQAPKQQTKPTTKREPEQKAPPRIKGWDSNRWENTKIGER
jgi:hypothetical protein